MIAMRDCCKKVSFSLNFAFNWLQSTLLEKKLLSFVDNKYYEKRFGDDARPL